MFQKKFTIIILAITLITSCKKYPDGPLINLNSRDKRIAGEWNVHYFSINGNDSTDYLKEQPYFGKYVIYVEKNYKNKIILGFQSKDLSHNTIVNYNCSGRSVFENKNKSLRWYFIGNHPPGNCGPFRAKDVNWDIQRLTDTELWLKTNYDGKEYYIKFKH